MSENVLSQSQVEVKMGFNPKGLGIAVLVGLLIWVIPTPADLSVRAWNMLALFVATIVAIVAKAMSMGAATLVALVISGLTGLTPIKAKADDVAMLSGFANGTIWLIGIAMFLSRAVIKTGLGKRIALFFVEKLGNRMMGVAYGIAIADLIIAPGIPSASARGGGIMYPIMQSIADAYDSKPGPTAKRAGAFLALVVSQIDTIVCTMFLTAMAGNPLIAELAASQGIQISWMTWFLGAIVPGVACLFILPYLLYLIYPPELKHTPKMAEMAKEELKHMGKMSKAEWILALDFILLLFLWTVGDLAFGISATVSAFIGLTILLLSNIMTWKNIVSETTAWDTMFWFSVLVMMATALNKYGAIAWISTHISESIGSFSWPVAFTILVLVYFYTRYFFASAMAHISAMYLAFLAAAIAVGTPPMLAAVGLGYTSTLSMSLTQYAGGPGPALFGSGYNSAGQWWSVSFIMSIFSLIIWFGLGGAWMKLLGWW
ncbi:DASS family sodium-coupled anion symporter [Lonepinella koalarum]|uniref:DASS family divalent anion:Na+ symporter n=1 Tax=Lonepinella koalarum TaxID=53417 RepID=A0A4R1KSX6_9PAST|nr:DASS family sodium-coupled anion symporter [Lonepinella koalarum]MDH2927186.1 permease [Lonepinella koalarum]TCK68144.1 DASS family divalent anion:Na+ symporter [Lonepinella koalarum]TFJ89461.1 DASS family sodium-coupled anion symporter [Lonepinella koalarum]